MQRWTHFSAKEKMINEMTNKNISHVSKQICVDFIQSVGVVVVAAVDAAVAVVIVDVISVAHHVIKISRHGCE